MQYCENIESHIPTKCLGQRTSGYPASQRVFHQHCPREGHSYIQPESSLKKKETSHLNQFLYRDERFFFRPCLCGSVVLQPRHQHTPIQCYTCRADSVPEVSQYDTIEHLQSLSSNWFPIVVPSQAGTSIPLEFTASDIHHDSAQ